jgi:hypothetical protein
VHLAGIGAGLDARLRGPQVAGLVSPAAVEPGSNPGALGEQVSAAPGQSRDLGHGGQMPGLCQDAAPGVPGSRPDDPGHDSVI